MHPLMAGMSNLKYPTLSAALPAVTDPSCQLIQAADSRVVKKKHTNTSYPKKLWLNHIFFIEASEHSS